MLALKGNQGDLLDDVKLYLDSEAKGRPKGDLKTVGKDHGRIETGKSVGNREYRLVAAEK